MAKSCSAISLDLVLADHFAELEVLQDVSHASSSSTM